MSIDLNEKELAAMKAIRNALVHRGAVPSVRQLMEVLNYKSTYSVILILNKLIKAGFLSKKDGKLKLLKDLRESNLHARTVNVPLIGSVPCGSPLLAEENIESYIPISARIVKPPHKYFLLRADGDSMNAKNIEDCDLLIVRQQQNADIGETVVALIDGESTVKEFDKSRDYIILRPRSKNKKHQPIVVTGDFRIQGVVIGTITNL